MKTAVSAILVKTAVLMAPGLESPLLEALEAIHFLEEAGEIYRKLTDDEVDVFGAVVELHTVSELRRGLSNPDAHPTAAGVATWFTAKGFEAPPDLAGLLHSW